MEPLAIVINNVTQQVTLGYYTDPKYIIHLKYYFRVALLVPQNTNSVSASIQSWCENENITLVWNFHCAWVQKAGLAKHIRG